jgi:hypothetical protein
MMRRLENIQTMEKHDPFVRVRGSVKIQNTTNAMTVYNCASSMTSDSIKSYREGWYMRSHGEDEEYGKIIIRSRPSADTATRTYG